MSIRGGLNVIKVRRLGSGLGGGLGTLPGPLYEWQFASGPSPLTDLRQGQAITFTRGNVGTIVNSSGLIESITGNNPRFTYSLRGVKPLGLLMEEARTNRVTRSEELDHADWTATNTTVTANDETAPDGEITADEYEVSNTTASLLNATLSSGGFSTTSVFAVKDEHRWLRLIASASANSISGWFDLTNGVIGSTLDGGTGSADHLEIEDYGDYYRCLMIGTISGGSVNHVIVNAPDDEETTAADESILTAWGAMYHVGGPSTYIPTGSSTATRSDEVASTSVSLSEMSVVIEGRTASLDVPLATEQVLWQSDDGSATDRVGIYRDASEVLRFRCTTASTEICNISLGTIGNNTDFKVAFRAFDNDMSVALDGVLGTPDTSGTISGDMDTLRFGTDEGSNDHWNGSIKSVKIYDVALTDAQLVALSS